MAQATAQQEQLKMAEELLFSDKHELSFAKLLYFGIFDADRVFPYPGANEEKRREADDFLAKLKPYCDEHLDPDWIDRNARIPDNVVRGLGELGLLGMTIPTEYGGRGMSQYSYCRAMEEVASRCGGTAVFVNAHQSIGLKAILLFGSEEQRARYLPALARGEELAAFALTEPNAGSDAANVQTRAVFDPLRNVYRINGQKQWITNGGIAKLLTLMAKTEIETPSGTSDKITAFLVTPDLTGFRVVDKALEKCGIRGTMTAKLAFEDMEVPAENILGPKGGGLKVALTCLDFGRLTFGACCTGAAKFHLARAIEHARTRVQFERPLATFGLVKKKLATMAALVYAMDATTYLTTGLMDSGEGDFMVETAMLKVFASDALWQINFETMQLLGGRSFFTDEPFERMMRDARLNTIGEGSNEVMRAFIGLVGMRDVGMQLKDVLGALKAPIRQFGKLADFSRQSIERVLSTPRVPVRSPQLLGEANRLALAIRRFGIAVQRLLAKHGERIVDQRIEQLGIDRIATSAMALYTSSAVLCKLDSDLSAADWHVESLGSDLAVGKLYCQLALEQIEQALGSLFKNSDEQLVAVADRLTGMP